MPDVEGLISIIVPVYNVEDYFEKCAYSIMAQTYTNLEIIFVNDGSTDLSGELCDRFAALDDRIIVIHQENAGMSVARNRALDIARGEYIGFVDSDDFIDSDMYRVLYDKAVETKSDIVECNLHHNYRTGEDTEIVTKYFDRESLICLGRCVPWNKLYRHDLIRNSGIRFPPGLYYEDMEFYVKLIPYVKKYEYVDIAPYHYVQRAVSINNYSSERTGHVFQILCNIDIYYKQNDLYGAYRDALEFLWARVLLCSSFLRMCNIPNAAIRRELLRKNLKTLVLRYPNWKGNPILKKQKSKQALFMRCISPAVYRMLSVVFPIYCAANRRISSKWY